MSSAKKKRQPGSRTRKPPRLSEMVLHRVQDAEALLASIGSYKELLSETLSRRHRPRLLPGETLPDYLLLLELTGRDVQAALDLLVEYDGRLSERKAERFGLQLDRDQLLQGQAYRHLSSVRSQIDGVFGREAGARVHGLKGRTPRTAARLEAEIDRLVRLLENPKARFPEPRVRGFEQERKLWLRLLSDPGEEIERLRKKLRLVKAEIQGLGVRRRQAMAEFDLVYAEAVRYLKAVMVMAREDVSMIKLLRPRYQRRRNAKRAREKREARAAEAAPAPSPDEAPARDEAEEESLAEERLRLQLVQRRRPGKTVA